MKLSEVKTLSEAKSPKMPLAGHAYHKKTDAELKYIVKDAGESAKSLKGTKSENKYLDQMNDASTILHYRKISESTSDENIKVVKCTSKFRGFNNCHEVLNGKKHLGVVWQDKAGTEWKCEHSASGHSYDGMKTMDEAISQVCSDAGIVYEHGLTEAKNHLGETEYTSYNSWKRGCKKEDSTVWFDGDEDICSAMVGPKPYKRGETKSVGEWDGEVGVVYKKDSKSINEGIVEFPGASSSDMKAIISKLNADSHSPEWEDTNRLSSKNSETMKAMTVMAKDFVKTKTVKEAKDAKEIGWYVCDSKDKCVAGPMSESKAKAKCKELGGDEKGYTVSYTSDYDARRMNEALEVETVQSPNGVRPKGIGWTLKKAGEQSGKDYSIWERRFKKVPDAKMSSVKEDANLQALGKSLNKKEVPAEEAPVEDEESKEHEASETPAEEKAEHEEPKFKIGDKVKPLIGPHKGEVHTIKKIIDSEDGKTQYAITPDGVDSSANKYNKGGANATEEQLQLAEGLKIKAGQSLLMALEGYSDKESEAFAKGAVSESTLDRSAIITIIEDQMAVYADKASYEKAKMCVPSEMKEIALADLLKDVKKTAVNEASPDKSGMMPLSYRTSGPAGAKHKIEAYGRKGMKNSMWRKTFKNEEALEKWCEDNDATVDGSRDIKDGE
jgi:hypothetical protein